MGFFRSLLGAFGGGTYSTTFAATENIISEGGRWFNGKKDGTDWSNMQVVSAGFVVGTQAGGGFDDSIGCLYGTWGPTQTATAVVKTSGSMAQSGSFMEIELHLRRIITPHWSTGYEFIFSANTTDLYVQIVRWDGGLNSFTPLDARVAGVVNGDTIKATAVGDTLTLYVNNSPIFNVTDSTFKNGSPGIGTYYKNDPANPITVDKFGLSSFTATDK